MKKYFDTNRQLWDAKTDIHINSDFYKMDEFLKGATSLQEIELAELTEVKGKSMLHLQCHFGQDSISWARKGAKVTGVDLSPKSIERAKELAEGEQVNASFICSNVYDLPQHLDQQFDIVFTSYGTIIWLPDLDKWAALIRKYLKEGGVFYMVDFHPFMMMLDDDLDFGYSYFNTGRPYEEVEEGTYADQNSHIAKKEYFWSHSISEILNALVRNGLTLQRFNEFDYSPYPALPPMKETSTGRWQMQPMKEVVPHCYSITCIR